MPESQFTCPGCSRSVDVPRSKVGRWVECPYCKTGFAALLDEPAADAEKETLDSYAEEPTERPKIPPLAYVVAAGVFFVALVVGLIAIAVNKSKDKSASRTTSAQPGNVEMPRAVPTTPASNPVFPMADLSGTINSIVRSIIISIVVWAILVIATVAWIARDARARGMGGTATWVGMVMFAGPLALLVYLASRPSGSLIVCKNCGYKKLEYAKLCPHCGQKKSARRRS